MESFWGVILKPEKRYEQVVEKPFHITKACIEPSTATSVTSVLIESENDEFIICNLGGNILNETLSLDFYPGEKICIRTSGGSGVVHLTGTMMQDMPDFDGEATDESEDDVEEIPTLKVLKRKNDDSLLSQNKKQKKAEVEKATKMKNKLTKEQSTAHESDDSDDSSEDMDYTTNLVEELESDYGEEESDDDESDEESSPPPQIKGKKNGLPNGKKQDEKSLNKTPSKDGDAKTPIKDGDSKTPTKRNIKGIAVEDIKVGGGPEAKSGKMIGMYYEGRLKSGKRFDANLTGKPFKFRLGAGEVIKGWDLGLAGIKVGGKRRLTIPPNMAYGAKGAPPDIPSNAILVFDVECKFVN